MKGSLQFVPEGWKVVPEEPTDEMVNIANMIQGEEWASIKDAIYGAIEAAPQLTTPPVLRWEGESLMMFNAKLAFIDPTPLTTGRFFCVIHADQNVHLFANSIEEARRAAEKALGLPIVKEV